MRLEHLADEAMLRLHETADALDNLEHAILTGKSKRPISDLQMRRKRLPAVASVAWAMRVLVDYRARLPDDLIAQLEKDVGKKDFWRT